MDHHHRRSDLKHHPEKLKQHLKDEISKRPVDLCSQSFFKVAKLVQQQRGVEESLLAHKP